MRAWVALAALVGMLPAVVRSQELQTGREAIWEVSAMLYAYTLADAGGYLQPTLAADRGWLHLELRYNYEFIDAGSVWLGSNLGWGDSLHVEFTPMVGVVVGSADGVALGYHFDVDWRRLVFYIEAEYVFDTGVREESFLYSWSELTLEPLDGLRAGLVAQRTRAWESSLDIQRGVLLGYEGRHAGLVGYFFNPDKDDTAWVLALQVGF